MMCGDEAFSGFCWRVECGVVLYLPDDLSQQNYLEITVANKHVKALQHPAARNIRITLRLRHGIVIRGAGERGVVW